MMAANSTSRRTHQNRRRFQITSGDPRNSLGRRNNRGLQRGPFLTQTEALNRLRTALSNAEDRSLAEGSKITNKSQFAYWTEFCQLFDIQVDEFGQLPPGQMMPTLEAVRKEEETLAAFMAFVVACPRIGKKCNTANYALQCISAVRSHYAIHSGRRPGLREGSKTGGRLKSVIRGFQKTHPSRQEARMPILQQHLRAIRTQLDIQENSYHKTLWALWLTQWQGVLRSSDLIKRQRDAQKPWSPDLDTHRGRLSVDAAKDLQGNVIGARIKLLLKPNKTDQTGEKKTVKTFVIDEQPDALSAGRAIREMLSADPDDDGLQNTPLFRNPRNGKEITYEESSSALQLLLKQAGFDEEKMGTHSLRIGGATAYANATTGGYAVSGFMGLWASASKDWYMHACTPRLDMAAMEIGRASTWEVATRPGPVAAYAS